MEGFVAEAVEGWTISFRQKVKGEEEREEPLTPDLASMLQRDGIVPLPDSGGLDPHLHLTLQRDSSFLLHVHRGLGPQTSPSPSLE